jgi:cysteinyl-tRNA synthetase
LPLVRNISKYVFKTLKTFGVYEDDDMPAVSEGQSLNYEEVITPFMNALSKYRDQVKEKAGEGAKALFQLSDELRDDILPFLGIRLEDRGKG